MFSAKMFFVWNEDSITKSTKSNPHWGSLVSIFLLNSAAGTMTQNLFLCQECRKILWELSPLLAKVVSYLLAVNWSKLEKDMCFHSWHFHPETVGNQRPWSFHWKWGRWEGSWKCHPLFIYPPLLCLPAATLLGYLGWKQPSRVSFFAWKILYLCPTSYRVRKIHTKKKWVEKQPNRLQPAWINLYERNKAPICVNWEYFKLNTSLWFEQCGVFHKHLTVEIKKLIKPKPQPTEIITEIVLNIPYVGLKCSHVLFYWGKWKHSEAGC